MMAKMSALRYDMTNSDSMKYTTKEIKPGILSISITAENDIEADLLQRKDADKDEIIDVYYQDAVSKFNENFELSQIIDIINWPNAAVVKYEVVMGAKR
ncbi:MAG: hypothetical protein RLO81_03885 [Fulvivirga sp.]|uniref:hypothetical protein n=1 Tax=Fulvivirga sp. TaxID=1931237 RepID=UPI0032EAF16E